MWQACNLLTHDNYIHRNMLSDPATAHVHVSCHPHSSPASLCAHHQSCQHSVVVCKCCVLSACCILILMQGMCCFASCTACLHKQVLQHNDALPEDDLSVGYLATKAVFEQRFDMLYDPPLTTSVPPDQLHPAAAVVGQQLLAMLGPPSPALLRLRAMRARAQEKRAEVAALIKQVGISRHMEPYGIRDQFSQPVVCLRAQRWLHSSSR
jgi:hypothetical protein